MNFKSKSSRNGSTRGRSVKYPNVYDVIAKVEAGKPTNWIENAILAGFTPDEIEAMIEANLEQRLKLYFYGDDSNELYPN